MKRLLCLIFGHRWFYAGEMMPLCAKRWPDSFETICARCGRRALEALK